MVLVSVAYANAQRCSIGNTITNKGTPSEAATQVCGSIPLFGATHDAYREQAQAK